jgi:hypothetical protein
MDAERRKLARTLPSVMNRELTAAQLASLADLERFGWELKFTRRPMFQQPIPVVFDPDRKHFAVLKPDGTLDEHPDFVIRK